MLSGFGTELIPRLISVEAFENLVCNINRFGVILKFCLKQGLIFREERTYTYESLEKLRLVSYIKGYALETFLRAIPWCADGEKVFSSEMEH